MKFLKTRVLPLFLAFVLSVSMLVVPASASGTFPDDLYDDYSVGDWNAQMNAGSSITLSAIASYFGIDADPRDVFWHLVDGRIGQCYGEVGLGELEALAESFNQAFNTPAHEYFLLQAADGVATIYKDTFAQCTIGTLSPNFKVTFDVARNVYRIIETNTSIYVVDSAGRYPYVEDDGEYLGTDQWLPISVMDGGIYRMLSKESIYNLADDVGGTVYTRGNYLCISKAASSPLVDKMVLANEDGKPYVCWKDKNQSATEQERPTTNVTENGNIVEGDDNSVNLDLEGMTMLLPGGTLAFIDQIIYDESTKSYHIDSHDTYNYTVNNYYTWNYYINYTSITYIGQTEEYNKYYEVYYELPDGRDSADLTKEDLEQLNLSVDVIPYGRSADDTSLRSLYHFDGDTKDSSYWNYCTKFEWLEGASLTYMDSGVFDGALYLDETMHKFTITLPSAISTQDFTVQFRYYQSATPAPVNDSYVIIGGDDIVHFDGANLRTGPGDVICALPIGTWNEIAIMRENGNVYVYLNGVRVHSEYTNAALSDQIHFRFSPGQQTYKYLDELRILNYSLVYGGANYECTSVPYDTNLTLVLPDSATPVADEYWSFDQTITPAWSQDFSTGYSNRFISSSLVSVSDVFEGNTGKIFYTSGKTTVNEYSDYVSVATSGSSSSFYGNTGGAGLCIPITGYRSPNYANMWGYLGSSLPSRDGRGDHTFSVVTRDGDICSLTFESIYSTSMEDKIRASASFDWGSIYYVELSNNAHKYCYIWIVPKAGVTLDFVYMELVRGGSPNTGHEFVQSVTAIDKDDLNTPTLAVRTDIDITSYQIGGVRPSIPQKGMVWAMVENERITSLQVYNGQAWEGVDGRIWTGERWIPMSSYNIVTLQDLYDIVDATPNYEYIYSEAGFWSWWQKSWNAFTEKLFATLGAGGAAGGTSIKPDKLPSVPDDESTAEDDGWSFVELLVVLKDGTWNVITGVVSTAYDGFSGFVQAVSDSSGFFDYYDPENEQSIFFIPLEEGASVWD